MSNKEESKSETEYVHVVGWKGEGLPILTGGALPPSKKEVYQRYIDEWEKLWNPIVSQEDFLGKNPDEIDFNVTLSQAEDIFRWYGRNKAPIMNLIGLINDNNLEENFGGRHHLHPSPAN